VLKAKLNLLPKPTTCNFFLIATTGWISLRLLVFTLHETRKKMSCLNGTALVINNAQKKGFNKETKKVKVGV
jgi:hypothetical protein